MQLVRGETTVSEAAKRARVDRATVAKRRGSPARVRMQRWRHGGQVAVGNNETSNLRRPVERHAGWAWQCHSRRAPDRGKRERRYPPGWQPLARRSVPMAALSFEPFGLAGPAASRRSADGIVC